MAPHPRNAPVNSIAVDSPHNARYLGFSLFRSAVGTLTYLPLCICSGVDVATLKALYDTGSQVNLISSDVVTQLGFTTFPLTTPIVLRSFPGSASSLTSCVPLTYRYNDVFYQFCVQTQSFQN
jgi:hypothetical protein